MSNIELLKQKRDELQEKVDEALLEYNNSGFKPVTAQDRLYSIYAALLTELEDVEAQLEELLVKY